jgi:hypothetical protein
MSAGSLPVGLETGPAGLGRDHVFIPPARIVGMIAKEKEKRKKILTEQCGESLRRITRQRIQPNNKVIESQELKKNSLKAWPSRAAISCSSKRCILRTPVFVSMDGKKAEKL